MKNKFIQKFRNYLSTEIAIEYKACLYFYCIMVYYCIYLVLSDRFSASILHMCEMILTAYIMGYIQIYALHNFDESDTFGLKETGAAFFCTVLYTITSYLLCWFDQNVMATIIFFCFILFSYWCIYLINKLKRTIDTKQLNDLLTEFKKEGN